MTLRNTLRWILLVTALVAMPSAVSSLAIPCELCGCGSYCNTPCVPPDDPNWITCGQWGVCRCIPSCEEKAATLSAENLLFVERPVCASEADAAEVVLPAPAYEERQAPTPDRRPLSETAGTT